MVNRHTLAASAVLLAILACGNKSSDQQADKQEKVQDGATSSKVPIPALNAPIPLDPKIKMGTLDNGLTYLVRANKGTENRGEFRLVVNAGSLHEDDDQLGLAHFVEHLAFNGTAAFPKNELISSLEKLGVTFGPHINASTSHDETIYMLKVPTDDPASIDLTLKILEQWAHQVTFLPKDIDDERGVLLAEERHHDNPERRMTELLLTNVLAGSRYAERMPGGDPAIVKSAPPETIERFYRDWYHPENMAVVAVGDFDAAAIEAKIKTRFAGLKRTETVRPPPSRTLPVSETVKFVELSDKELPFAAVLAGRIIDVPASKTAADWKAFLTTFLATSVISARLAEAKVLGDASYLVAQGVPAPLTRGRLGVGYFAAVAPGGMEKGLKDLLAELERARRHGMVKSELTRAKAHIFSLFGNLAKEAADDKTSNESLADELGELFLTGEPAPSKEVAFELVKAVAATITKADVERELSSFMGAKGLIVVSAAPTSLSVLSSEQALAALAELPQLELVAYSDTKSNEPLMATLPTPGTIRSETTNEALGTTEWTLSNGARVVLKPTTFKSDEILLRAISPGGTSVVATDALPATRSAAEIVRAAGLGALDRVALEKALAGRRVSVAPFIGSFSEGIEASSSVDDVETMLQMVHLAFAHPRKDEPAFKRWQESRTQQLRLSKNKPDVVFIRKVRETIRNGDPRRVELTEKGVAAISLEKSFALYKQRFADSSDFTFHIVGSFDPEVIKPLVLRYLGSLTDSERVESIKPHQWPLVSKNKRPLVRAGETQRARLLVIGQREIEGDISAKDQIAWALLGETLRMQLLELFREQLGETYTLGAETEFDGPQTVATLYVDFRTKPESADALETRLLNELKSAVAAGGSLEHFEKAKKAALTKLETDRRKNQYWVDELSTRTLWDRPTKELANSKALIESVTHADLKAIATRLANVKKPTVGILKPVKL